MKRTPPLLSLAALALAAACQSAAHSNADGGSKDAGLDAELDAGPTLLNEDPISATAQSLGDHEPTVAAAPDGHLAVSWATYVADGITIGYRISNDNGATWGPATLLPFPTGDNVQANASVAADSLGNLYLAWGAEHQDSAGDRSVQHVFFAQAGPGDLQFGTPVEVDDPSEQVGVYDQPHVVVTANGTLDISYEKDSVDYTTAYIVDAVSSDGLTWTRTNVAGPGSAGSGRGFARICAPPTEGRLYIVYFDSDLGLALSWSDDDGMSWMTGTATTVQEPSETGELAGVNQSCVADGSSVWVLYPLTENNVSGPYQTVALLSNLRLAYSSNAGASIDSREDIEDPKSGQYYLNPLLSGEPSGALDVAYYAGGCTDDSAATLRLARSVDGTTFSPSVALHQPLVLETSRTVEQWFGDYLGMTDADGTLDVVYADNSGSTTSIGFFSTNSPAATPSQGSTAASSCNAPDGGAILSIGSNCAVPQTEAQVDPCAAFDLQCAPASPTATTDTCQLPGEFYACSMDAGCSQSPVAYACVGVPGNGNLCIQGCKISTDCSDTLTSCQELTATTTYCIPNYCGPGVQPANGATFYGPCTVTSGNDGYCFPWEIVTTNGTGTSPQGYCQATGTAARNAPCQYSRTDAGTAALCGAGLSCVTDATGIDSYCEPVCELDQIPGEADAGPDGGASLACGGATCANWADQADWGICVSTCSTSSTCDAPATCQAISLVGGDALMSCIP